MEEVQPRSESYQRPLFKESLAARVLLLDIGQYLCMGP